MPCPINGLTACAGVVHLTWRHVHIEDVYPGRPNVWARFAGRDPSRTVLLDAHTDTVSHLHMAIEPFGAEVRDGRLYGRGACDTKGPMAALLLGLGGGPGVDVTWTQLYPALETDPESDGVRRLGAALRAVTGDAPHAVAAYATNGGQYACAGIPGVVFGPGSIADAHTANESIELRQVATAADVIRRFLVGA